MPKEHKKLEKKEIKYRITLSRRNGTGVQELIYTKLKIDEFIIFEGEKYWILTTRKDIGRKKGKTIYCK